MKRFLSKFAIFCLALLPSLTSCGGSNGDGDEPKGYSADVTLDKVNFVNVTALNASAYKIDMSLTNGAYELTLAIGSKADDLDEGTYAYADASALATGKAAMALSVYGKSYTFTDPSLKVSHEGNDHKIVFEATVNSKDRMRLSYKGEISFKPVVGADGLLLRDQILPSKVMEGNMLYTVYLPPSWDGKKNFPVLYLLHGATNFGALGNNDWVDGAYFHDKLAAMIKQGTAAEMVVIMPNCCVDGENLFYCDNYEGGKYQYMTYFFTELVPTLEEKYCIQSDRKHRVVSGLSMGGYGSLYYGSLHPEMFAYVYACSPATWLSGAPSIFDLFDKDVKNCAEIPGITIEIGTEDFLFSSAEMLKGHLTKLGIPFDYITRPGAHDWRFWDVCAPKIITKATETFK